MAESARDRLLKQFRELVVERLERITKSVMALEDAQSPESGRAALRELHGLKGEARMMGFPDINSVVHEMEELVRSVEPRGFSLSGGSTDALLVAADAVSVLAGATQVSGTPPEVQKLVDWLKQRITAEKPAAAAPIAAPVPIPAPEASSEPSVAKVEIAEDPARVAAAAELPVLARAPAKDARETKPPAKADSDRRTEGVRIGAASLDLLTTSVTNLSQLARRRELASSRRLSLARELASIARIAEDLGPAAVELATRLNRAKEVAADLHREAKLLANEELRDLTQVSEEIQALRMLPLSVLFESYPRMVRDLARELGKDIDLVIEGEGTRADRTVVDALRDPLLHLVRNALDHGLEGRAARAQSGKSPRGHLILRATREGERILLRVEDDGVGLDPQTLREIAVKRGFLDAGAASQLSDQAARELIFIAGFSSKEVATDLSGRGVGLDVVRVRLQSLGGDVALYSEIGKGSTFELRVPVSLTVAPLLFIRAGEENLCLTAAHIEHALKVEKDQVADIAGRPGIRVDDEVLPFASLASILGTAPERAPQEGELVLLVRGQGATAAISVDRVLEERVQAILPLKGILSRFPHLTGATNLADGSLAMVLSAAHLISTARGIATSRIEQLSPKAVVQRRRRILVVDDSPLTRELISSLLEGVGYDIVNAADGQEAFDKLGRDAVDMVVTDLEMPRMDGLELTRRVKSHPTLRSLPVVIITTRGADADRRRGMDAGADGYIAKGDLVRQDLVDVVSRLLS